MLNNLSEQISECLNHAEDYARKPPPAWTTLPSNKTF
jgi:hypothetical protein